MNKEERQAMMRSMTEQFFGSMGAEEKKEAFRRFTLSAPWPRRSRGSLPGAHSMDDSCLLLRTRYQRSPTESAWWAGAGATMPDQVDARTQIKSSP